MLNKTDTGTNPPLRIFLVGVPRSGTTLLQSMLAAHPDVTSFTESHFFSMHFRYSTPLRKFVLTQDPSERVRAFLEENDGPLSVAPSFPWRRLDCPLPDIAQLTAYRLIKLLDDLAEARCKSVWVEKTPDHLKFLRLIKSATRFSGNVRFVHIVRNGPEVVSSLRAASKAWGNELSVEHCVDMWHRYLDITHSRVGTPIDHVVFYEDLVAAPELVLRAVLDSLQLPWSPKVLSDYAAAADRLIAKGEHWKAGNRGAIGGRQRENAALSSDEERFVRDHLDLDRYTRLRKRVSGRSLGGIRDSLRRLARRPVS